MKEKTHFWGEEIFTNPLCQALSSVKIVLRPQSANIGKPISTRRLWNSDIGYMLCDTCGRLLLPDSFYQEAW